MEEQVNIPSYKKDRDIFKAMAAKKGISMKDLFHEWIEKWQEWEKFR